MCPPHRKLLLVGQVRPGNLGGPLMPGALAHGHNMDKEDIWEMTGQSVYDYYGLLRTEPDAVRAYVGWSAGLFTAKAGAWDVGANTEWIARHYLAVKLLLSSQVMFTSAEYA